MAEPLLTVNHGDDEGEWWSATVVYAGHLTADDAETAAYDQGFESHYGGPGRAFCRGAGVEHCDRQRAMELAGVAEADLTPAQRVAFSGDAFTCISCSGGMDI